MINKTIALILKCILLLTLICFFSSLFSETFKENQISFNTEPPHKIVPGNGKNIIIIVSAISDYSTYDCKTFDIEFKDTFLYEV